MCTFRSPRLKRLALFLNAPWYRLPSTNLLLQRLCNTILKTVKRRLLLRVLAVPAFLLLFGAVIWLSLQSAFIVNRAATLDAPILGYRVRVEAISFSPDLHARITGLAITPLNDK